TWSASGLSKAHVPVLLAALAMGGHVRVGLEDNLYYTRGVLAESNAQLVERAAALIRTAGLTVATPDEAREILSIRK
ncbi:MAG: 3-keto-5-aminohexanoate cleavage protein, partial [Eubacterium sp.]|nr:3-keto-5-aminohexanoate cleavage protein [Eubacterium sp.]